MLDKIWGFIIDIIIAIVVMFIVVFMHFGLRSETVISTLNKTATEEFESGAKKNGYITLDGYENFMSQLTSTNLLYDVSLKHSYTMLEPEYRMRTLQEILDAQKAAWTGKNVYTYRDIATSVPAVSDPVNTGTLNTETNASVMAAAHDTAASTSHVHTDACYLGHHHVQGTKTFTWYHAHTSDCRSYLWKAELFRTCQVCGTRYQGYGNYFYWDRERNTSVSGYCWQNWKCPNCNTESSANAVQYLDYAYSCGFNKDMDGDGHTDNTVPEGVTYEYPNNTAPQNPGTYYSGCYSYHKHKKLVPSWYIMYEPYLDFRYGNILAPGGRQNPEPWLNTLKANGAHYYCNVPLSMRWYVSGIYLYFNGEMYQGAPRYHLTTSHPAGYYSSWSGGGTPAGYSKEWWSLQDVVDLLTGRTMPTLYNYLVDKNSQYAQAIWQQFHYQDHPIIGWQDCYPYGIYPIYDYNTWVWYETTVDNDAIESNTSVIYNDATNIVDWCDYTDGPADQWNLCCGKVEDTTLDCGAIVTSISPTHPNQRVATGDPLITTVIITHADGSTTTQIGTCNFSTASVCSNQTATITYNYIIDGVSYSKKCNINVTVVQRTKTCPNGHVYNLKSDGTDPGCPYCSAWVKSIKLVNPNTTDFSVTIGTTLEESGVKLLVTYMNGQTETITSGYVDNLDTNYLGVQQVTIGYKGITMQCKVTTICKKMTCSICGYVYDLYPDGSDPGCPKCISKVPVFTGNVMKTNYCDYSDDILTTLYKDGIYKFNVNDTFSIQVKNRSKTPTRNILKRIFPSINEIWFNITKSEKIWRE